MKKTKQTVLLFLAFLLIPLLGGLMVFAPKVSAATITVTTTADEDDDPGTGCSLYEAIQAANTDNVYGGCSAGSGADTINVPAGTYSTALNPLQSISSSVTILGAESGGTIIEGGQLGISTEGSDQTYLLRNLTIRDSPDSGISIYGQNENYAVTIDRVTIEDNGSSGITHTRNDFVDTGTVTITNSLIQNNSGRGLSNNECQGVGTMYVTNTMIRGNDTSGIWNDCGHVVLNRVTVSNNTNADSGGGIVSMGEIDMTNVTIFDNTSDSEGGGIALLSGSGSSDYEDSELINVTVAGNSAPAVGGILYNGLPSPVIMYNVLNADNQGTQCSDGLDNDIAGSNNMASDESCSFYVDDYFSVVSDAKLATALADNGGEAPIGSGGLGGNVLTLALLQGSPAIDAGNNDFCPEIDERDTDRPFGGTCDIGAFEANYTATAITNGSGATTPATLADTGQNMALLTFSAMVSVLLGSFLLLNVFKLLFV